MTTDKVFDYSRFPALATRRLTLCQARLTDAADVLVCRGDPYVQRIHDPVFENVGEAEGLTWMGRLPQFRHALPDEWSTDKERRRLAACTVLVIASRTVAMNPLDETRTRQIRTRPWGEGRLLHWEIHAQRLCRKHDQPSDEEGG